MRIPRLLIPLVLLLVLGACGDDSDDSAGDKDDDSSVAAVAADLAGCLVDAGLDARVSDATAIAVDDEHVGIDVNGMDVEAASYTLDDADQGADLYVVADEATATKNFTGFTLATEQDDKAWVAGRVVVRMHYPANRDHPQVQALEECVADVG